MFLSRYKVLVLLQVIVLCTGWAQKPVKAPGTPIPPSALSEVPPNWASKVLQVPVPNFAGKTLLQVQNEAVAPGGRPLFVDIFPKAPLDGVVQENGQSPRPGSMVVPGTQRLALKLRIPPKPEPERTAVPPVKGLGMQEVEARLEKARLLPKFSGPRDGIAGDPSPPVGTPVDVGSSVTIEFAPPPVMVPPLKGLTLDGAKQRLADSLLQLGAVNGENTDGATVESQVPEPLTPIERGSLVEVTMVAAPPPQVPVPDLTGKSCAEAHALIIASALRPASNDCPHVHVLVARQIPEAGTLVDPQSMVSTFYARVRVPPLIGLSAQAAVDRLSIAGLEGLVSAPKDWNPTDCVVASQFPQEGSETDVGSAVSVVMKTLPWWEKMPVWGWITIGISGLSGLWILSYVLRPKPTPPVPPLPPPVITFDPHVAMGHIRLRGQDGPKVRFAITLRDHKSESRITFRDDPAAEELEVK